MFQIKLINMPFAHLNNPSLALTQLRAVVGDQFAERVETSIHYLNQDFGRYLGLDYYNDIAYRLMHFASGLGDWIFRQAAFPDAEDNANLFFKRYYPRGDVKTKEFIAYTLDRRAGIGEFLNGLIDTYRLDEADLVGFTSMFAQNVSSFALARKLKERNPDVTIVMGGANCEYPMGLELVHMVPQVDFVFSSPGLVSFPKFLGSLLDGDMNACHRISGVFSRRNADQVEFKTPGDMLVNIQGGDGASIIPVGEELNINTPLDLDYDSFLDDIERNFTDNPIEPSLMFETSRGCWWGEKSHCTFCGYNTFAMYYRAMRPENAIALIRSLFKYSGRAKYLECVDNILPMTYIDDVLPYLETPEDVNIFYETKSNLKEEHVRSLAKARINVIQPGIESLNTGTLRLMRKGATAFINLALLKYAVMHGVWLEWNLIVGFPGEKGEVYEKYIRDIPLLVHLPPPNAAVTLRYDRYSPYFDHPEEFGLNLKPFDYYPMVYPDVDQKALDRLSYFFVDHNFSAPHFLDMVKWKPQLDETIEMWRASWPRDGSVDTPQLYLFDRDGHTLIHDSRSGAPAEHAVRPDTLRVLQSIQGKGLKPARLASLLDLPESVVDDAISWLDRRRFLFHEDGVYMSVVLPARPEHVGFRHPVEV